MLFEPVCAIAMPAVPVPARRPFATAVVTGVTFAFRIDESATVTTSTLNA